MPKAKRTRSTSTPTTPPVPPTVSPILTAAHAARMANADYHSALARIPDAAGRPSEAEAKLIDASADRRRRACRDLATMPATTLMEWQAKACVLAEAAVHSRNQAPVIHDGEGLVWSLLNDLLAMPLPA